jgi:cell pole-organizing protein PopZ
MDEILASIRRIISEDNPLIGPLPPPSLAEESDGVLLLTRRAPPEAPEPSIAQDHVMAPLEIAANDPEPAPDPAPPEIPPPPPGPEIEPIQPEPEAPPPELEAPPPEAEPQIPPPASEPEPEVTTIDTELDIQAPPPEPNTQIPPPEPEPIAAMAPIPAFTPEDLGIVAEDIAASAAAAFQELSFVIENTPAPPSVSVSAAGPTLEDITRDLLRPMLKAWLDEHLPQIVRARVSEEVERIARRGVR